MAGNTRHSRISHPAAALAVCLVEADPRNPDAWIKLARIVRRAENVEEAEKVLFKARAWHPKNALVAFNLACYASVKRISLTRIKT